ncbi:MAG TPA: hypothetical protein VJ840_03590 [Gemmatimonadaceae bacterium]|nr:hypothetical protein [Gemmatimonadaceae bacterium]
MREAFLSLLAGAFMMTPLPAQTVQIGAFNSIDLPHGGHVVLERGATQRVSLVRGSLDVTRLAVTEGGRLVIDKCYRKCPRGYRLELQVITPGITGASLSNGGSIETRGTFPAQSVLTVAVSNGGTIDVRSLVANRVNASVNQGGRILTVPQAWLMATVTQGGVVTYWGNGQVRSSIDHGGVVQMGSADELDLPLSEIGPATISH